MQIKTILNRVQKFKSFVYGATRWVEGASVPTLEVEIQPRSNSRPVCSGCGHKRPGYDRLPERVDKIRHSLSVKSYQKLLAGNKQDLFLFDYVSSILESRTVSDS